MERIRNLIYELRVNDENFANEFAAQLLVPIDVIERIIVEHVSSFEED